MTKVILLIWIGIIQSQTMATETFETMAECEAVAAALLQHDWRLQSSCIEYSF